MPITKGEEWGNRGVLPPGAPLASSDAEAAALVDEEHQVIGLVAGDLARTLGVGSTYDRASPKQLLPVDAIRVELDDGTQRLCVAHVVVGNLLTSRHTIAIMNAAFVGSRNLAPRAHPGDGKVDVVDVRLTMPDRLKAWRRMVTGTHVPHPGISIKRRATDTFDFGVARRVTIDGQRCGRSRTLTYTVVPEAIVVAV